MSELAASSNAPANGSLAAALAPFGGGAAPAPGAAPAKALNGSGADLPFIHDEDIPKCTNCKTCYQQVSEVFELTKIVVDGAPKDVAHTIPGVLAKLKITPELKARVARVAANCDAEIIR
jgi:pyruvate-ferredoxin/flavodoxin oxidoreductase